MRLEYFSRMILELKINVFWLTNYFHKTPDILDYLGILKIVYNIEHNVTYLVNIKRPLNRERNTLLKQPWYPNIAANLS